jgi:hypothetical protein
MWLVFFIGAVVWIFLLLFYITIEMNQLDKALSDLAESVKKHYGS